MRPTASFHPGPPRFVQVGEKIVDPIFVDYDHGYDRDNIAPWIAGTPEKDPDPYSADDFEWSITSAPADSDAELLYAPTPYDEHATQYDHGSHNTVEFIPDVPGTYVFELDAPDGTHELTIEAFPEAPPGAEGPPRLALDGYVDEDAAAFVIEPNAELAPNSISWDENLHVAYRPHDRSSLSQADVEIEDDVARIPIEAVEEPTSVFAAPFDGHLLGAVDEIELDPDAETVRLPNRPPAWLDDAVIYQIFPRSFHGKPNGTDFAFLTEKVAYLADLGIDAIWLTPIVPAWSATVGAETDHHPPGGPHGYSTEDYFDVAPDLGTMAEFETFVDACHDHDVKVCFDLVINHCGWTNPYFQDTIAELGPDPENFYEFPDIEAWNEASDYFDWFDRQTEATEHDAAPAQTSFYDVRLQPNLNYGNVALREHILAAVDFWSDVVDAFRADIAWGVPHSFWKEVRALVREKDSEFMLLDEGIPRIPEFGESEFDLHFDTRHFMYTAHKIVRGEAPPTALLDAIEKRRRDGFPTYSRIINSTENHDEPRIYQQAREAGVRDPARAQRAAAAATFALPGVPQLYYGQERLISEYGTRRTSPFEDVADRSDDIERDPYKRAFMNWEEQGATVPTEHLQFYNDLIEYYHDSPVLGPNADVVRIGFQTDASDDVLAFGLDSDAGCRIVLINFGDEAAIVEIQDDVDTTDRFSGADVLVDDTGGTTTVEVDTLAILDASTLFSCRA
jgi:glycosidase